MTNSHLKKITIDELAVGMFVHAIADQQGNLSVKTQGRVTKPSVIDGLRRKGVKSLVIDLSKQIEDESKAPAPEPAPEEDKKTVSFEQEIGKANTLHKQGKHLQKTLLRAVQKGLPFDEQIPREFTQSMVGSIDRNPDALMCLTKIREKDEYLLEHSLNVAILLANFGKSVGMSIQAVEELALAGFLHDLGKIKIPDDILHKPGRLTDEEMDVMRDHVKYGVETLEKEGIDKSLIRTVSEHHERLDGKGYPAGKSGEKISQEGRMIAIADVYDALTADRVYKAGMPSQKALQILLKDSPHKYDHDLLQKFIKCMGIYPVGTLVKLTNERVGMVMEQNSDAPLKPIVRMFYSTRGNHYLEPKDLDLNSSTTVRIEKPVVASEYKLDTKQFFERSVLNIV
ncbi:HD-GYP domain-containing protein [Alteromonas sediminis]|uniref:HD-GYP domain-containing protein n=1 Tax=Alteromonas sediminis TaxID=2259342 RepID=A0A3N5ZAX6_9ALTE|nr:HD-GYP domain-containing protein [Alteromonas sediminis]RPJ66748.1 HD-GYP domain-containing protein [Alteromonas sediminis]